ADFAGVVPGGGGGRVDGVGGVRGADPVVHGLRAGADAGDHAERRGGRRHAAGGLGEGGLAGGVSAVVGGGGLAGVDAGLGIVRGRGGVVGGVVHGDPAVRSGHEFFPGEPAVGADEVGHFRD